jgi:hypothetical protein
MAGLFPELHPTLVWGLFARGLGLLYLVSFASLSVQVVRSAGRDGGFSRRLERIRKDFPGFRRVLYFPTLLWLSDSDAMLRILCTAGFAARAERSTAARYRRCR